LDEEASAVLRESAHEQLDALRESELSVKGAVALGLVAAADAPALKQIEGKRKGGAIGGAEKGSKLGHRKPNKTPAQERRSAQDSARYHMKKVAKAAHPQ
jgi:hypothetical protein